MKKTIVGFGLFLLLLAGGARCQTTQWDSQDYDLYTGDFNGDGRTDILYIAKNPSVPSGIALSDVNGNPTVGWQSWQSNFLGIQWSGNAYKVIVADFNGDGKADILLQSVAPGNSYLLLTSSGGKVVGISQTIPDSFMGLIWSADQHNIISGDFNGDGHADLFLQAATELGTNAVVLSDSNGMFTATAPVQTWADSYLGFRWSAEEANVFAGDFTGAGRADLLIQAKPSNVVVNSDVAFPVPTYPPNMNGVVLSQGTAPFFSAVGVQSWSRMSDGVDWSPLSNNIVIGTDSNKQSIVILQSLTTGGISYQLIGSNSGAIFAGGATALDLPASFAGNAYRLLAGNFKGTAGVQLYSQPLMTAGTNGSGGSSGVSNTATSQVSAMSVIQVASAAGRTQGQFSVASDGSATYTIPIETPPGAGGAQLKLALAYSSRSPNGVMGVGWSIGGMSVITRCNKTFAQDGVAGGVTLQLSSTYSDRFCLDGKQLKLTGSTNYGYANSTYATEIESFSLIQAGSTMVGNGPASFTVTTKNGLIYTYGGTTDSEVLAGTSGTIRTWALSQIADRVGNKISLVYQQSNGTYRIDHILYPTTAGGQGPFYDVLFSYSARPSNDIPSSYVDGYLVTEPNQLNSIETMEYPNHGGFIKQYNLVYTQGTATNRNTLTALQECSASTCLSPTSIQYQPGTKGWNTTPGPFTTTGQPTFADMNGDGLKDLVYQDGSSGIILVQFQSSTGLGSPVSTGIWGSVMATGSFLGSGSQQIIFFNGTQLGVLSYNASPGTFSTSYISPITGSIGAVTAADLDGDGLDDLVLVMGGNGNWTNLYALHNTTHPPGAATFGAPFTIWTPPSGQKIVLSGGPYGYYGTGSLSRADFNGDGRADVLAVTSSGGSPAALYATPLISNGASSPFTPLPSFSFTPVSGGFNVAPIITDWNGDGCTDIITPDSTDKYLLVEVSNCAGGFTAIQTAVGTGATLLSTADWDGDGRQDLLYNNASGSAYALLSTGTGYGAAIALGTPPFSNGVSQTFGVWSQIADAIGDGSSAIVFMSYPGSGFTLNGTFYLHQGRATPPDLATSFTDGYGMNESPTYVPLTNTSYYTKNSDAVYPEEDYQLPLYVVNQFTASDGTGTTYQNEFFYWGARTNVQGRGFEGFFERSTYDTRNDLYTYDYYERPFPYTGMPIGQILATSTHNLRDWTSAPNDQLLGSGYQSRWFRYLSPVTTTVWEANGSKNGDQIAQSTKTTTYGDGFGNPTVIVTSTTDQDSTAPVSPFNGLTWTQTINASYYNDTTNNCFGLPDTLSDQRVVPGQTTQTRNYAYLADTTKCRLTQKTVEPGVVGLQVTTVYSFDDKCTLGGNTVAVTGENPDGSVMATRTTNYNYAYSTSRCQLPERITNALGESTSITYNYDFGVPTRIADPNHLATTYQQDDYGRNTQETRPDGTYSTTSFSSCSSGPCWGYIDLRFLSITSDYGSDQSYINQRNLYFDGFNRIRGELSYRANGLGHPTVWNYDAFHIYDSLGRQTQLDRPYSSASNGYAMWTYDALNRITSAQLYQPNGTLDRTTQTLYLGRTIETTDPRNNTVERVTDVSGKLRRVMDPAPGGTTQYAFDAFGNQNQTIDSIGATSSATFNLRGFRTQMVDPDAGTWNYTGDSLNELVSWQDAKNNSFSTVYDLLGRMTSRSEPEGTSTWTWGSNPSLYNVDKLAQVSGYGYTENLSYDSASRMAGRQIISDSTYQYSYTYNTQGLLSTVIYPTSPIPSGTTGANFTIQYTYSAGEPVEIQDITNSPAIPLWTSVSETDSRLVASEIVGTSTGAVNAAIGYKVWTDEILSLQSGSGGSTTNLQNLGYTWDTTGNLTQRGDANQAGSCTVNGSGSKLCEVFTPDSLNRLSSSTLNGTSNLSVGYDAAGDIISKSDVGTYTYPAPTAPHPHGVLSAGSNSYTYDANGNVATKNSLTQTWASYNLPDSLQGSPSGTTYSSQFAYGPEHKRYKEVSAFSDGTETTEFVGEDLEKLTATSPGLTYWRHYVSAPSGHHIIVNRNSDFSTTKYFVLTDHLGSSDTVVNGTTGGIGLQESFSPFGQRRQTNWTPGVPSSWYTTASNQGFRRGFTFHEQLDGVGFVHMNGRVYDPTTGRFLSVDPVTGDGTYSQRENPYAYVSNRPLVSTDPTGLDSQEDNKEAPGGEIDPSIFPGPVVTITTYRADFVFEINSQGSAVADTSGSSTSAEAGAGVPAPPGANGADKASSSSDSLPTTVVEGLSIRQSIELQEKVTEGDERLLWEGKHLPADVQPKSLGEIIVTAAKGGVDFVNDHKVDVAMLLLAPEGELEKVVVAGIRDAAEGATTVYRSVGVAGEINYVGITNDLARRAAEQLRSKGIQIEKLMGGLSRSDARAVEQALIEINGLGKNGGTLLNQINSVATSNPGYANQLSRGYELLKSIGYGR